jgi:hypothetical protein
MMAIDTLSNFEEEARYVLRQRDNLRQLTDQHRKRLIKQLLDQSLTRPDVDKLVYILSLTDKENG